MAALERGAGLGEGSVLGLVESKLEKKRNKKTEVMIEEEFWLLDCIPDYWIACIA